MRRAPALSFLLATVFIDMLGLGLIVPIVPALMGTVTADAAGAARWSGVIGSSYGILQFLTAPRLGRLADRYGRRPVLLASLGFLGLDYLAHAVRPTVASLLIFHGLAGAFAGTGIVVNAYVADVTPPHRRARAYGLVGAAFSLGFVAGPALGGLLGAVDVRLPFVVAAILAFVNVAYGLLILPESRPGHRTTPLTRIGNRLSRRRGAAITGDRKSPPDPRPTQLLRTLVAFTGPFGALAAVLRRPVLGRLAAARFCDDIARNVQQSVWTFFVSYQLAWGTTRIGVVMAAGALAGALFSAYAIGPVVRVLGDKRAAVLGAALNFMTLAGTAFVTTAAHVYTWQAVGALSAVGGAAAQSWISRVTGADEQGTVQGALTGGAALAEALVPAGAGAVFAWSLPHGRPGLAFLAGAVFAAAAAVLLATTRAVDEAMPATVS